MKFAFSTVSSLALLILLSGCNAPSADTNSTASGNEPAAVGEKKSDITEIPADLKSDAFEYYGLGNKEESKFTITQNGKTETGTTRYSFIAMKDGKATFELKNAGALAQLGTVELELSKDGIKTVKMENMTVDPESFELVSGLTPGKSWKFKVTLQDKSVLEGKNEVVGTQEVKTAVNTYKDALLIKSVVTGKQNGKPIKSNTQTWLVKGRGQVKTVIENEQDGKKTTSTIEESK